MKKTKCIFLVTFLCIGFVSFAGPNEDLINACKQGDLAAVQAALDAGAEIEATDAGGNTALCNAYFWPDIVKLLLDNGADPNGGNYPALITASNVYSTEVVKLLLDAGADPNKPGIIDMGATYRDLIEKEKAKGKKKANKALIKAYESALASAATTEMPAVNALCMQTNHVEGLKLMIEAGMKLELADGSNALNIFGNYAMSREERKELFGKSKPAFDQQGVKVPDWYLNLPDEKNGKATDMLQVLIEAGADINNTDANGFTPLCSLVKGALLSSENTKRAKTESAKLLIESGADVNASSTLTNTKWTYYPICLAAELGDLSLVELLVEKGADIDIEVVSGTMTLFSQYAAVMESGGGGYTATTVGILAGNLDVAEFLANKGADLTIGVHGFATLESGKEGLKCLTTVKNKSPIYWAIEKRNQELVVMLGEKMAGNRMPEYQVRLWSNVGSADANTDKVTYYCPKLKKLTYSPSEHAGLVGNESAAEYLSSIGL